MAMTLDHHADEVAALRAALAAAEQRAGKAEAELMAARAHNAAADAMIAQLKLAIAKAQRRFGDLQSYPSRN